MKQDEQMIEELLNAYSTALNNSDAAAIAALYVRDGCFMPDGLPTIKGPHKILASAEKFFERRTVQAGYSILNVVVDQNFGIVESVATVAIKNFAGHATSMKTRDLFVLKRQAGSWKIARYIFNTFNKK
ncbi:SgcJ/EcaC family oxidoreductase [Dyadobacter sp. CY312]|nr:SgcJ/EcaC family oxidoreductase [Dyadobacter sp. CY312]